jgi:hypothetical protein
MKNWVGQDESFKGDDTATKIIKVILITICLICFWIGPMVLR